MSENSVRETQRELPSTDLIEIDDPEIDQEAIMAEIRRRIQERRQELGYETKQFGTYGGSHFPGRPDDVPYDPDFYDHLELANSLYLQAPTEVDLQPSPATHVPVLGSLWSLIREQVHGLVLYYVNRSVSHQTGVNREIISVLNKMTAINLEQQRTIGRLQAELDELRAELEKRKS
jgi:hypothetical protein